MTNTGNRFIIGILLLGYILLSLCLFLMLLFSWSMPFSYFELIFSDPLVKWAYGVLLAVVFILSCICFVKNIGRRPVKFSVLHETDFGQISITLSALEQLVLKGASSVSGVREVKPSLRLTAEGFALLLKVQVIPDIHIPQVTSDLQNTVKEYLLRTSGTSLQEIEVQVVKISSDIRTPKISRVE